MKLKNYIIFGFLGLLISSCEDFLEKNPSDSLSTTTYWTSKENAEKAVVACYPYLGDEWWTTFLTCATDDSYAWSNWPCDVLYVTDGSATTGLGTFGHFWSHFYGAIAATNNVLDNIDKIEMNDDDKNQLKAEARFIRAFAYHRLVGLYGDVPLIEHVQTPSEYMVSRTPSSVVYDFIVTELEDLAQYLPNSYDDNEWGKVTKGAAWALEARALLYSGKYAEAAVAANKVIKLDIYNIDPDYLSLFNGTNERSSEIILSAQYTSEYKSALSTWVGGPFVGGWSEVVPLQSLVDAYECTDGLTIDKSTLYDKDTPFANRDPRLSLTIALPGDTVNGIEVDITDPGSKYKLGESNASYSAYYYKKYIPTEVAGDWYANSTNDIILFRYAEVLLIYAEAKIEANDIDNSVYEAINEIRNRADVKMPTIISPKTQSELREIVRREKRVEMALEQERLFDIRRWKIGKEVLDGNVYGILNNFDNTRSDFGENVLVGTRVFNENRDYLWPVPQAEKDINKNLEQNTNW